MCGEQSATQWGLLRKASAPSRFSLGLNCYHPMSSTVDKSRGGNAPLPQSLPRFLQVPGFGLPLNFTPYEAYDTQKWNGEKEEYEPIHVKGEGEGVRLMPNALNSRDLDGGSAS